MSTIEYAERKVLIVEDHPEIAASIKDRLLAESFSVDTAENGFEAIDKALSTNYDLIILDIMLPGVNGRKVLKKIRAKKDVPRLILTALDDESEIISGLSSGADDYMTKPFSLRELVERVKALLRRVKRERIVKSGENNIKTGDFFIDVERVKVFKDDVELHLTPTEFYLLLRLVENERHVLSREELLESVWNWPKATETRVVDSYIKFLREKIGQGYIRTVHGVGYAFEPNGMAA
jgi:DNA-binding response OmpR family regulator